MATNEHSAPARAQDPIVTGARLLKTMTAAYTARAEAFSGEPADLLETVRATKTKLLEGAADTTDDDIYDALDLVTIAEAALAAGLKPENGKTIDPLMCVLRIASERLEAMGPPPERIAPRVARLMHRFDVATGQLELAAGHWKGPYDAGEDLGAVTIMRQVSDELADIYIELGDWLRETGNVPPHGAWVDDFEEQEPDEG